MSLYLGILLFIVLVCFVAHFSILVYRDHRSRQAASRVWDVVDDLPDWGKKDSSFDFNFDD